MGYLSDVYYEIFCVLYSVQVFAMLVNMYFYILFNENSVKKVNVKALSSTLSCVNIFLKKYFIPKKKIISEINNLLVYWSHFFFLHPKLNHKIICILIAKSSSIICVCVVLISSLTQRCDVIASV